MTAKKTIYNWQSYVSRRGIRGASFQAKVSKIQKKIGPTSTFVVAGASLAVTVATSGLATGISHYAKARPQSSVSLVSWSDTKPSPSHPLADKADRIVQHLASSGKGNQRARVIVRLAPHCSLHDAEQSLCAVGGTVYRRLDLIHAIAADVPSGSLSRLAMLPGVVHLSSDGVVRKTDEFIVQHSGADVAFAPVSGGGYGLTGNGVGVAVLDSGVKGLADLQDNPYSGANRLVYSINFCSSSTGTGDLLGHGTHVAGIIAGNGKNSTGGGFFRTFYGVARRANIVNVRVLDKYGNGAVSDVIAGINWVIQNRAKYKIRVLNVSLGHPVYESYTTDPLNQAVEAAWQSGIVVVCSAGNNGRLQDAADPSNPDNEGFGTNYGSVAVPGNDPCVITVGAMKQDASKIPAGGYSANRNYDAISTYSSRGPSRLDMVMKPDLVAPGNRVISLCADNSYLDVTYTTTNDLAWKAYKTTKDTGYSNQYFVLSGTSMAAPVVSGAAALLLEKDPTLSPDSVKARLMLSADKWTGRDGHTDPFTYGAGYLNIPAALNSTVSVPSGYTASSPVVVVASDGNIYVSMNQAIWGSAGTTKPRTLWYSGISDLQSVWGYQAIQGTNIISDYQTVNGTRAIWGKANSVQGDQAIWGRATSSAADISTKAINGE